jgi:2,4'-dihydroxyacetophenone dioxygenase
MSSKPVPIPGIPAALHRGEEDIPFVKFDEGTDMQVLHVDIEGALWVIRTRIKPGTTVQRHKHTGEVFAFTIAGAWKYLEYPEINTAGSYLYEPAGSIHTLHVPEDNEGITDVWFAIRGANLNLDEEGNVESVLDAGAILETYLQLCDEQGFKRPPIIGT